MKFNVRGARCAATAGLIGTPAFPSAAQNTLRSVAIPFFPSTSDPLMEGFARVINQSADHGEVRIEVFDDSRRAYGPVSLSVDGRKTVHFNSDDLHGGGAIQFFAGVGPGQGDWRLSSGLDIEVLSYVVAADAFQTTIHDPVPSEGTGHRVAILNPASDLEQSSELRLVNLGGETANITITGIDDTGQSPGGGATISIAPGAGRTLTSFQLEFPNAVGLTGSLGHGGCWAGATRGRRRWASASRTRRANPPWAGVLPRRGAQRSCSVSTSRVRGASATPADPSTASGSGLAGDSRGARRRLRVSARGLAARCARRRPRARPPRPVPVEHPVVSARCVGGRGG